LIKVKTGMVIVERISEEKDSVDIIQLKQTMR